MKTVVEKLLDELKSISSLDDAVYMHFESRRQNWLDKEKEQIIRAVEWNDRSNMGEVYYNAVYNDKINYGEVIECGDKLYKEMHPNSKMDTPSVFYESLENKWIEWNNADTNLSFYEWCK